MANAEGQAEALAAAMTDTLATKQDLRELEARIDARFAQVVGQVDSRFAQVDARFEYLERHLDTRLVELERRMEIRFDRQNDRFDGKLADMERRVTLRLGGIMVASVGAFSALVSALITLR